MAFSSSLLSGLQTCLYGKIGEHALSNPEISDLLARALGLILPKPADLTDCTIDLVAVRALGFDGLPDCCPEIRALYWKLTMGYLPNQVTEWETHLLKKRTEYQSLCKELCSNENLPEALRITQNSLSPLKATLPEGVSALSVEVFDQINKDVYRTRRENTPFFGRLFKKNGEEEIHIAEVADIIDPKNGYDQIARSLFLYAILNPGIRYVQGMNELIAVLYYVFRQDSLTPSVEAVEADTFYCFTILMGEQRDCFLKNMDSSETGVHAKIHQCNTLLRALDYQVWQKLKSDGVDPTFYSLRWLMLLLSQELSLNDTTRLWDSLLHDPSPNSLIKKSEPNNNIYKYNNSTNNQTNPLTANAIYSDYREPSSIIGGLGSKDQKERISSNSKDKEMTDASIITISTAMNSTNTAMSSNSSPSDGFAKKPSDPTGLDPSLGEVSTVGTIGNTTLTTGAETTATTDSDVVSTTAKKPHDILSDKPPPPKVEAEKKTAEPQMFSLADDSDEAKSSAGDDNDPFSHFDPKKYDIRTTAFSPGGRKLVDKDEKAYQANFLSFTRGRTESSSSTGSNSTSNPKNEKIQSNFSNNLRDNLRHLNEAESIDELLPRVEQQPFLHYVCVSMIIKVREAILAGDFISSMKILQSYPPFEIKEILILSVEKMRQHELKLRGLAAGKAVLSFAGTAITELGKGVLTTTGGVLNTTGNAVTGAGGWLFGKLTEGLVKESTGDYQHIEYGMEHTTGYALPPYTSTMINPNFNPYLGFGEGGFDSGISSVNHSVNNPPSIQLNNPPSIQPSSPIQPPLQATLMDNTAISRSNSNSNPNSTTNPMARTGSGGLPVGTSSSSSAPGNIDSSLANDPFANDPLFADIQRDQRNLDSSLNISGVPPPPPPSNATSSTTPEGDLASLMKGKANTLLGWFNG